MKIIRILTSRFKKDKKEQWVLDRRKTCSLCHYNSLNQKKLSLKIKILKTLSDFYTWITFQEKTDLGTCTDCGCDLFYKTMTEEENCGK
jgi:hypothetical protein